MILDNGRYRARFATGRADVARAQALRHRCFLAPRGLVRADGLDQDCFDAQCQHVLIENSASGNLVACFRLLPLPEPSQITRSYAAQVYDLAALAQYPGPLLEIGRFCLHPDDHAPEILRLCWAALTRIVDAGGIRLLFGCTSFAGSDIGLHQAALAALRPRLAPPQWAPRRRAAQTYDFASALSPADPQQALPPLLRSYLALGAWVSDHAVIDADLDTVHVFTGLEIANIPAARARALRALAA